MADQTLSEYCLDIEKRETNRRVPWTHPIYIRIDGHKFSKFTKGMKRPFDNRMTESMRDLTVELMKAFDARLGYTQSDEISLVLYNPSSEYHIHGGKLQKITSRIASKATAKFHSICRRYGLTEFIIQHGIPEFDTRAYEMKNLYDTSRFLLWRHQDAIRNAISMTAQTHFSHKQLQGKSSEEMLEMMNEIGLAYDVMPRCFRFGRFLQKSKKIVMLSKEELAKIPEKHRPTEPVERNMITESLVVKRQTIQDILKMMLTPEDYENGLEKMFIDGDF